jgi:hypothetical protein
LKKANLVTIIILLTIALSLLPLFQPKNFWVGYGSMGSHFYKNNFYEIHYGEASTGVYKPQIYFLTLYDRIPLVEISDQGSELNELRIYGNLSENIRIEGNILISSYNDGLLIKKVEPKKDEIQVSYIMNKESNLTITFWRWYYDRVENVTKYDLFNEKLNSSNIIYYTFSYYNKPCVGEMIFNQAPNEIIVHGDDVGVNKIVTSFINTKNVSVLIKIFQKPEVILTLSSYIVYPFIAVIILGVYIVISLFPLRFKIRYSLRENFINNRNFLKPIYLAIISFIIRIILAPFFMHVWDVTTIQEALNDFISGKNVYASVEEKTFMLRQVNGVEANYEGFAYLPHLLLIYLPFYFIYKSIFSNVPAIIGGHLEAPLQLTTPNIYVFLLLIKLPTILADAIITYILAKKSSKIGLLYAILPYSIMITSVWGNSDSIIGLLLLLTILIVSEKPLLAGIFYGISLMKLFIIVTFPAILLYLPKKWNHHINFILGILISQIPTIIFFIQGPNSMLNILLFHSIRSPGGVNIYNLAPKLYSYQLQSILNKITIVILFSIITLLLLKCKVQIERIVLSLALYMALGPVVNEQHLATLLPLLLLLNYDSLVLFLSTGYLVYALLYSGPTYFMAPLAKLLENSTIISDLNSSWTSLFCQITPQLLYTIALTCSLTIFFIVEKAMRKNRIDV